MVRIISQEIFRGVAVSKISENYERDIPDGDCEIRLQNFIIAVFLKCFENFLENL